MLNNQPNNTSTFSGKQIRHLRFDLQFKSYEKLYEGFNNDNL